MQENTPDDLPFHYIIIIAAAGGLVAVVITVLLIMACCCCAKKYGGKGKALGKVSPTNITVRVVGIVNPDCMEFGN